MKLFFGFLLFVAAIVITGGLYLAIRRPEETKADLEKLSTLCTRVVQCFERLCDSLVKLYTTTAARVIPGVRKERTSLPDQQSSATI
jgi:hypothetical protein